MYKPLFFKKILPNTIVVVRIKNTHSDLALNYDGWAVLDTHMKFHVRKRVYKYYMKFVLCAEKCDYDDYAVLWRCAFRRMKWVLYGSVPMWCDWRTSLCPSDKGALITYIHRNFFTLITGDADHVPRGLRHELSSHARTLGSWVPIPLKA
jgi:hypothetical protein